MMQLIILGLLAFAIHKTVSMETKVITTKTGKVQGVVEPSSISGKYVQKFSNIPYAEPPVGKLRFAKPQPKKPWNGTLNNTGVSLACWQKVYDTLPNITLTEDCLILNIWTPYPQKSNQSVMVWIHGGAFRWGISGTYAGNNFVPVGDVILVTINYRLSAFGFLTTDDDRIKGNFGLFDQRLAMKWVKENIASFGGDPQSITIFGESAGGASVSAHTLSERSWPYFDRAIQQSGSMNMPWSVASEEEVTNALDTFVSLTNCTDDEMLLECLQNNITTQDLERIYVTDADILEREWFTPCVDRDFFTNDPKALLKSGKIKNDDVIIGITKDEAFLQSEQLLQELSEDDEFQEFKDKLDDDINERFENISQEAFDQAIELYSPNEDFQSKEEALQPIIDFNSDILFACQAAKEANIRSQILHSSNIYQYRYSYASKIPTAVMYPNGTFGFASHGLDVISVFGLPVNNSIYPSEDQILSMRMILYWTNFAKTGDPNIGVTKLPIEIGDVNGLPKWPKFMNSTREYLDMESGSQMTIRKRLREEHCEFLRDPEGYTERHATTKSTKVPTEPTESTEPTEPTSFAVKHIAQVVLLLVPFLQLIL